MKSSVLLSALAPSKNKRMFIDGQFTTNYQIWRITFDDGTPEQRRKSRRRKRQEAVQLPPITAEEVDKDRFGTVLIAKLKQAAVSSGRGRLFDASHYALRYRLPDSPFEVLVHPDNPDEVRRAYREFDLVPNKVFRELAELDLLNLIPRTAGDLIFDPRPELLVPHELRNTARMTTWMADQYMKGRVKLDDLDELMGMGAFDMRKTTFKYVPLFEQPAHAYLDRPKRKKKLSLEDQYKKDLITLEEFADLKMPARRAEREARKLSYPRPEDPQMCVVCGNPRAHIKCIECDNRVCRECLETRFLVDMTAVDTEAFLLLHHVHCLRFGKPTPADQPRSKTEPRANFARVRDLEAEAKQAAEQKTHGQRAPSQQEAEQQPAAGGGGGGGRPSLTAPGSTDPTRRRRSIIQAAVS